MGDIGEKYKQNKDVVVDSIRNYFELEKLREEFSEDFKLIATNASQDIRWKRCQKVYENKLDLFLRDDLRDQGENEPKYGQTVQECVNNSDFILGNNKQLQSESDWKQLLFEVYRFIELVQNPGYRQPYPKESFMAQALIASCSSSCSKRRVGAVITTYSDDLISSGFNEVPFGQQKCKEIGGVNYCYKDDELKKVLREKIKQCPRCGKKIPPEVDSKFPYVCEGCELELPNGLIPGKSLDICVALHAEEDAILQAAKMGGYSLDQCVIYTTTFPCNLCSKQIIDVGIKKVIYIEPYPMTEAVGILGRGNVEMEEYTGVLPKAFISVFKKQD